MVEKPYAVQIIELNKDQKRQIDGLVGFATRVMNLSREETDKEGRFLEIAEAVRDRPYALYAVAERIAISHKSTHHRLAREAIRTAEFDEYLEIAVGRKTRAAANPTPAIAVTDQKKEQEGLKRTQLRERENQLLKQLINQGQSLLRAYIDWGAASGLNLINPVGIIIDDGRNTPKYWGDGTMILLGQKVVESFKSQEIFEAVVVAPVTRGSTGKLSTKEATGFGSDEPAVSINYYAAVGGDHPDLRFTYTDFRGRPGNMLDIKIIVPQSLAEQFTAILREDPTFVRRLMINTVHQKYNPTFTNGLFEQYDIPPYDKWEKYKTPKMYFVDALSNPSDAENLGKLKFDERNVIKFHTEEIDGWRFGVVEERSSKVGITSSAEPTASPA